MTGTWDDAQRFVLPQTGDLLDDDTTKLAACDSKMAPQYQALESRGEQDAALPDLPLAKPDAKSKHALTFNARAPIARVIGIALVIVYHLLKTREPYREESTAEYDHKRDSQMGDRGNTRHTVRPSYSSVSRAEQLSDFSWLAGWVLDGV